MEREWDIDVRHVHFVTLRHAHDVRIVGGCRGWTLQNPMRANLILRMDQHAELKSSRYLRLAVNSDVRSVSQTGRSSAYAAKGTWEFF